MKEKISNVINELLQRYKTVGSITDDDIIELILKYNLPLYLFTKISEEINHIISKSDKTQTSDSEIKKDINHEPLKLPDPIKPVKKRISNYDLTYDDLLMTDSQTVKERFFSDYGKSKMQSTYMVVFVLAFKNSMNEEGIAFSNLIVDFFREYYDKRRKEKLIIERPDSIFVKSSPNNKEIHRLILFNPIGRSYLRKYFKYDKISDSFQINPKLRDSLTSSDWSTIERESERLLEEYYNKIAKKIK